MLKAKLVCLIAKIRSVLEDFKPVHNHTWTHTIKEDAIESVDSRGAFDTSIFIMLALSAG